MENEKIIKIYSPYCEETHKRVLGICKDKEGNEFPYQPERSKREDANKIGPGFKYDDPKVSDVYL
jgi:hypothetical protein